MDSAVLATRLPRDRVIAAVIHDCVADVVHGCAAGIATVGAGAPRVIDVTTRRTVDDGEIVLITASFSPDLLFGEVAIVLREIEARVRELVPHAERITVEPRIGLPVRAQQPPTETIVLASSD